MEPVTETVAELVQGRDGWLYGVASRNARLLAGGGGVFRIRPDLTGFTVLASFPVAPGFDEPSGVIAGNDGNLYGLVRNRNLFDPVPRTTAFLFRLTPAGTYSVFSSFDVPLATVTSRSLFQTKDGEFYGTFCGSGGAFKVNIFGAPTDLALPDPSFCPSSLVQGADGALYGSNGNVFKLSAGQSPVAVAMPGPVTEGFSVGADGALYGGMGSSADAPRGRVFRLSTSLQPTTMATLGITDGFEPTAPPLRIADGTIYGTTTYGGTAGKGTIYRITPSGSLSTMASFTGQHGAYPYSKLVEGLDGFFYGTTLSGGPGAAGTVFRVSPDGSVSTVVAFAGTNGAHPRGALARGADGALYGTTFRGCSRGGGCVFRIDVSRVTPRSLHFAGISTAGSVAQTPAQRVQILPAIQQGFSWSVVASQPWLRVSRAAGTGPQAVDVSVDPHDPSVPAFGTVTGQLRFVFSGVGIPDATVPVTLELRPLGATNPAFGSLDTPTQSSVPVAGAIGVTGWALDDVGVAAVRVCRGAVSGEVAAPDSRCQPGEVFIGDATFVAGTRPDVAALHTALPLHDRAGWGLMVLTNVLPGGGNGDFTLSVHADDHDGNRTTLGHRTIVVDNARSEVPFGTIDTPGQGAVVSGVVTNFGWVLSPGEARADALGGAVVEVLIDGEVVGSPTGWTGREDLAALFPKGSYAGVDSALAASTFDSRNYADGVHTIAWRVVDSAGKASGIGSRFFAIANGSAAVRSGSGRQ